MCLYSTFLWPVEHESSRILKEQVLCPHILIYMDAFLFPINIYYYYAKGMFMVPCSKFQFVHNSSLSFKEELNIFLLDLRSKYVLCLLFLKEISRLNYLCVEYLWPYFIILFHNSKLSFKEERNNQICSYWTSEVSMVFMSSFL